jgi:hypothetical protein
VKVWNPGAERGEATRHCVGSKVAANLVLLPFQQVQVRERIAVYLPIFNLVVRQLHLAQGRRAETGMRMDMILMELNLMKL